MKGRIFCYSLCLLLSLALNLFFLITPAPTPALQLKQNWTLTAAQEAESVAAIPCSGHGRAYLDGFIDDNDDDQQQTPRCECNSCYGGSDCSVFTPNCPADADSGDPLFLEPFWMQHAAASAVLISGWHRMSYVFDDGAYISAELEKHIRRLHAVARNANTKGKRIIFGGGSTQLLNAAVFGLSTNFSSPGKVVAASPAYPLYKRQTDFFETKRFEYAGDASSLGNSTNRGGNIIEFVTSPNNPDGNLRDAVLKGPSVRSIHDHAYYWPHYTALPAPADEDVMIFTISKLTGHAGSRFGWAFVKDEDVYQTMQMYINTAEMGMGREVQLRALKLIKAILRGNGTEIFVHAYNKMSSRWRALSDIMALSKRFSIQEIPPRFCNFFEKVRGPSPAYAWVKCERQEDENCKAVLREANIISRGGKLFNVEERYTRLSLLKGDDDFNLLLYRLYQLVAEEGTTKAI